MVNGKRRGLSQAHLARELGVSGAMVSKHKAQGMPVDSISAARAWRRANLDPILLKTIRRPELCRTVEPAAPVKPGNPDLANELGREAFEALRRESWREFVALVEALRALLPMAEDEQDRLALPVEIWDALTLYQAPGAEKPDEISVEFHREEELKN